MDYQDTMDMFAAKMMVEISRQMREGGVNISHGRLAEMSYEMADAMMDERAVWIKRNMDV